MSKMPEIPNCSKGHPMRIVGDPIFPRDESVVKVLGTPFPRSITIREQHSFRCDPCGEDRIITKQTTVYSSPMIT